MKKSDYHSDYEGTSKFCSAAISKIACLLKSDRAVDKDNDTIDFMLSEKRDEPAANSFFSKAIGSSGLPAKITIDKSGTNKAGVDAINLQLIAFSLLGFSVIQIHVRNEIS